VVLVGDSLVTIDEYAGHKGQNCEADQIIALSGGDRITTSAPDNLAMGGMRATGPTRCHTRRRLTRALSLLDANDIFSGRRRGLVLKFFYGHGVFRHGFV